MELPEIIALIKRLTAQSEALFELLEEFSVVVNMPASMEKINRLTAIEHKLETLVNGDLWREVLEMPWDGGAPQYPLLPLGITPVPKVFLREFGEKRGD
jgi:hypothetical protein